MSEHNALAALVQQLDRGVPRIEPGVAMEGVGEDLVVVLRFPVKELQKARSGKGRRNSVGIAMIPVEFGLPDASMFLLGSPWMSITAR